VDLERRATGDRRGAPADDLRSAEALRHPHRFFRRLREHAPVHYSRASRGWILTGYAEVLAALKDDVRLSADRIHAVEERLRPEQRAALGYRSPNDFEKSHAGLRPGRAPSSPRLAASA
jgi:hypothetical protein